MCLLFPKIIILHLKVISEKIRKNPVNTEKTFSKYYTGGDIGVINDFPFDIIGHVSDAISHYVILLSTSPTYPFTLSYSKVVWSGIMIYHTYFACILIVTFPMSTEE